MNRPVSIHVPQRSCCICGRKVFKGEMMRIALLLKENQLELDSSQSRGGRGLYLCRSHECISEFIKKVKRGKMRKMGAFSRQKRDILIEKLLEHSTTVRKTEGGS